VKLRNQFGSFLIAAWCAASALAADSAPTASSPVLKVCSDPDNLPFSKSEGTVHGMYIDLAEMMGKQMGMTVEYNWWLSHNQRKALRLTILDKACDAYFALPADPEYRLRGLARTQAFIDVSYALVSAPTFKFNTLADLKGKRVAVLHGSPPHILLSRSEGYPTSSFLEQGEALAALAKGEVEAALLWGPAAGFENKNQKNPWRVTPVGGEGFSGQMAIAVQKDNPVLLAKMDKALLALAPEIQKLAQQYGFPLAKPVMLAEKATAPKTTQSTGHAAWQQGGILRVATESSQSEISKSEATKSETPKKKPAVSKTKAAAVVPVAETAPAKPVESPEAKLGHVRFNDACSHCHGADGISFVSERDLRRQKMRYQDKWMETTRATIKAGRPDAGMPTWKDILNDKQIDEVLSFLATVQK
jgi:polar amino acid transport system substrate-binding protein